MGKIHTFVCIASVTQIRVIWTNVNIKSEPLLVHFSLENWTLGEKKTDRHCAHEHKMLFGYSQVVLKPQVVAMPKTVYRYRRFSLEGHIKLMV